MSPLLYKIQILIALKFPPQSHYDYTRISSIKFQIKLFKPKSNRKKSHPRVAYLTTNLLIHPTYIRVHGKNVITNLQIFFSFHSSICNVCEYFPNCASSSLVHSNNTRMHTLIIKRGKISLPYAFRFFLY